MKTLIKKILKEDRYSHYDIDDKLKLLKSYIHILKNSGEDYELMKRYFIILHNFLLIERMFYKDVIMVGKEINKYLDLERLKSVEDVVHKFNELYDVNSIIRFNVETLDNIEPIRQYLKNNPQLYYKLLKK